MNVRSFGWFVTLVTITIPMLSSSAAWASARLYQFSGQVIALTPETISLKQGQELLEFDRNAVSSETLKVGDQATIWYTLEARKMKTREDKSQQPGEVAPSSKPEVIIDDRAFYDAMNDAAGTSQSDNAG